MNESAVKTEVIEILEGFKYPAFLQGSLAEADYPDHFFTFWNNSSLDNLHYDNLPVQYVWRFDINFYSIDPMLVNTLIPEVISEFRKRGWIVNGWGFDVPSDEETHTGRGFNALKLEF